jgi:transposase
VSDQELTLTIRQSQTYQILQAAIDGHRTNQQAAQALDLSIRQVQRLKAKIRALGPPGIRHGNAGRSPHNKVGPVLKDWILQAVKDIYHDYNFSHLADALYEEHGVVLSDETLRRWLRPGGHGAKPRRAKIHRRRRQRRSQEGELLFLDGSPHPWFGPDVEPVCLLLCTDDATGKPLWGTFQPQEDRDGCFEVCYHVFTRFGLPAGFYLDRGSQFIRTDHLAAKEGRTIPPTAFQVAMKSLSVGLTYAHSPQARGRGERINGSFQGRLVAEFVRYGIHTCKRATKYLNEKFIPRYANRFGRPAADPTPAWRPLPPEVRLPTILCAKDSRKVSKDNTVSFRGAIYQLDPPPQRHHLTNARVEVQSWFDGSVHFVHRTYRELHAKKLTRQKHEQPL